MRQSRCHFRGKLANGKGSGIPKALALLASVLMARESDKGVFGVQSAVVRGYIGGSNYYSSYIKDGI